MFRRSAAVITAAQTLGAMLVRGSAPIPRQQPIARPTPSALAVEPFEATAKLQPLYDQIGQLLAAKLGCDVKMYVATNYNAKIEADALG